MQKGSLISRWVFFGAALTVPAVLHLPAVFVKICCKWKAAHLICCHMPPITPFKAVLVSALSYALSCQR